MAGGADLEWVVGDAEQLPFPDASMDSYTIAFGIRNVTRISAALEEAHRVQFPPVAVNGAGAIACIIRFCSSAMRVCWETLRDLY